MANLLRKETIYYIIPIYQILSELPELCRRYYTKKHLDLVIFSGQCIIEYFALAPMLMK